MQKSLYFRGGVVLVGILLLMILAYGYSSMVTAMYDQRMHEDIQGLTQSLAQSGMPQEQIKALRSVLLDINRNTVSLVTSEVFNLVGVLSVMGIVIMSFSLTLAGREDGQKKEDGGTR